jgi:3-oxoacyl-ACP reductase-like protein
MSVLGSIMSKVFGHAGAAPAAAQTPAASPAPAASAGASAAPAPSPTPTAAPSAPNAATPTVDVEKVLSGMAAQSSQKLDWRNSIVDLMKLLGIDSSMVNRRALASELGYTGDLNDSATMNTWLHKAVMQKLAENGGKVPATLLD